MGRIKSTLIKRTAEKLMKEHEFTEDFGENKKIIEGIMPSKRMRNMVAGYITRLVKQNHTKQQKA